MQRQRHGVFSQVFFILRASSFSPLLASFSGREKTSEHAASAILGRATLTDGGENPSRQGIRRGGPRKHQSESPKAQVLCVRKHRHTFTFTQALHTPCTVTTAHNTPLYEYGTGKKTPGGAGTHTVPVKRHRGRRDTQEDTRIARTNLTSTPHKSQPSRPTNAHTHNRATSPEPIEPAVPTEPRGRLSPCQGRVAATALPPYGTGKKTPYNVQ